MANSRVTGAGFIVLAAALVVLGFIIFTDKYSAPNSVPTQETAKAATAKSQSQQSGHASGSSRTTEMDSLSTKKSSKSALKEETESSTGNKHSSEKAKSPRNKSSKKGRSNLPSAEPLSAPHTNIIRPIDQ